MKIDIVTVVYDDETYLLEWQGKSISKYFDSNYINEIIVVDNGSQKCAEKINPEWYSQNKNKLKILNHQDINLTIQPRLDGWRTQQLCKILASAQSKVDWSIVLDAKTLFARNIDMNAWFVNNQPQTGWKTSEGLSEDVINFLTDYFQINFTTQLNPGGIPFFFHTSTLRNMIAFIPNFNTWFQDHVCESVEPYRTFVLEFALYSAYLLKIKNGFESLYGRKKQITPFNLSDWQIKNNPEKFAEILLPIYDTISIKEDAKKHLSEAQKTQWNKFLHDKYN